jgi:hypothetical protein
VVAQRAVEAVDERRTVVIGDSLVELDEEHQPWDGSPHQLGDGRDEVVPAPQRGQGLVDGRR